MQYAIITFRPLCSTVHQIPGLNLFFVKMFGLEILYKILNFAFLKIQIPKTLKFDAVVSFFSLPCIKMNITTLLKHLCKKRCIK